MGTQRNNSRVKTKKIKKIFTSGGSESDNQAIETIKDYGIRNNKYHIISTAFEHHAVLNSLKRLENLGFEIELIKPSADGLIKTDDIKNAIKSNTAGISVMYANNEIGTIQPLHK
ncbi:aminotransferase class V-fold PLP-dependent enzyme [Succinivibrio sp.]|uniref:aminotransferase class V-fold PLP-dependent enzyme n=2 Tax=Succinivibrio sp. TaxID=2053619 RepID=UPI00386A5645